MLLSGANTFDTSKESKAIIKLMRNYNFLPDSIINNTKLLERVSRILENNLNSIELMAIAKGNDRNLGREILYTKSGEKNLKPNDPLLIP